MGNNAAYAQFEATVIALYDEGVLTLKVLDILGNMHRGTDIDSGGAQDLRTMDGKGLEQVCVELVHPGYEPDTEVWEDEDDSVHEDWWSPFADIRNDRWGWR